MRVQFKADAICTLVLVVVLFTMLYSQLGHTSLREEKVKGQKPPLMATRRVFHVPIALQKQTAVEKAKMISSMKPGEGGGQDAMVTTLPPLTQPAFDFKRYLRNKDNRKFDLLINQPKKCKRNPGGPFLLIAIKSLVEDFDRREIVRKTCETLSVAMSGAASGSSGAGASSVGSVVRRFLAEYSSGTPSRLKVLDAYLLYVMLTGALQFGYCLGVGTFPFNSFLSGFISAVGSFILGVCLRIQINPQNKGEFQGISPERAFADFLFASTILHLVVINFVG